MSREVANRIRAALNTPGGRVQVDRGDLEVAAATLESVDEALSAQLVAQRQEVEIAAAVNSNLMDAHLRLLETLPAGAAEPLDGMPPTVRSES